MYNRGDICNEHAEDGDATIERMLEERQRDCSISISLGEDVPRQLLDETHVLCTPPLWSTREGRNDAEDNECNGMDEIANILACA